MDNNSLHHGVGGGGKGRGRRKGRGEGLTERGPSLCLTLSRRTLYHLATKAIKIKHVNTISAQIITSQ